MESENQIEQTIGAIYDAALNSHLWPDALRSVGELVDAHIATLETRHSPSGFFRMHRFGLTDEQLALIKRWNYQSPYLIRRNAAPLNKAILGHSLVSLAEYRRSFFYHQVSRPIDAVHMCGLALRNEPDRFCALTVWRGERQDAFRDVEATKLDILGPHLSRGVRIASMLDQGTSRAEGLEAFLTGLAVGVLLLDFRQRIIFANSEAERLLAAGPVRVRAGQLAMSGGASSGALQALLAHIRMGKSGATAHVENDQRAVQLLANPMPKRAGEYRRFEPAAAAIVIMIDEELRPRPPLELIRRLYRLTIAEVRLTESLLRGELPTEYAERRRLSKNTIKTQLRSIYDKTGARRQSELIRRLAPLALVGQFDRDEG